MSTTAEAFDELDRLMAENPPPPPAKRRIGKFKISTAAIESDWHRLLPIMARVVVLRAEALYYNQCIEYVALCDEFDEREDGADVPEYQAILLRDASGAPTFGHWEKRP